MKPISYGNVKREVLKNKAFKEFKKEFVEKMNLFSEYPRAIDITTTGCVNFKVSIVRYENEEDVLDLRFCYRTRSIIKKHNYDSKELSVLVLDNICNDLTKLLNEYYSEEFAGVWISLKSVELCELDKYDKPRIERFIAWDYGEVGIWYVEQECGEHWIKLPTSWNTNMPDMFHREIDKNYEKAN